MRSEVEELFDKGVVNEGLHDPHSSRRNLSAAISLHNEGATLGHPGSQHFMAIAYDTGLLKVEEDAEGGVNEAKAVLYDYFAALEGEPGAQAALGYRHLNGYSVPKSCESALLYYEVAANSAMQKRQSEPAWPVHEKVRLSEVSMIGRRSQADVDAEVVQYYEYTALGGNVDAVRMLGNMLLHGSRGVEQDHRKAEMYFEKAAALGDPVASGALGRMYLHGIGVQRNFSKALELFRRNPEDAESSLGLGFMKMHGILMPRDVPAAVATFEQTVNRATSSRTVHADAFFYLGEALSGDNSTAPKYEPGEIEGQGYGEGPGVVLDLAKALGSYLIAAQHGHVEALHRAGSMFARGTGTIRNCAQATANFKNAVEGGALAPKAAAAYNRYLAGDYDGALLLYLSAAEEGFELAQSNAGWLLEHGTCLGASPKECERVALRMYQRAVDQDRADAKLKVGDFHYFGKGGLPADPSKAMQFYYQAATEGKHPQAMFNVGWMYTAGDGVEQDFHLAKRYYDLASTSGFDANFPVKLAIWGMYARMWAQKVTKRLPVDFDSMLSISQARKKLLTEVIAFDTVMLLVMALAVVYILRRLRRRRARVAALHQHHE